MLKKFFKFVIPSILSMWIYGLYTIVDGIFISRGVGDTALAAVNISMPYVMFIYTIGILIATGVSTLISIAFGEGNIQYANSLFSFNILVVSLISLVLTVLTLTFLEPLAYFLGASKENIVFVKEYIGTISYFSICFIISYNMEVLVKADGTPSVAALGVLSCGLSNVLLDYIFVIRLNWGVKGAAFATGLAQLISTVTFSIYFLHFSKKLHFTRIKNLIKVYKKIITLGMANGFTELSGGLTIFLFNHIILKTIGDVGIISYTVISYINTFVLNTMAGITQGIQPLVSYYFGSRDKKIYLQIFKYSLKLDALLTSVLLIILEGFARNVTEIFLKNSDPEILIYTSNALKVYSLSFIFIGFNVISAGFLTAVEQPVYSFLISSGRGFFILIISLITFTLLFGDQGIWVSPIASETICTFLAIYFLKKTLQVDRHHRM